MLLFDAMTAQMVVCTEPTCSIPEFSWAFGERKHRHFTSNDIVAMTLNLKYKKKENNTVRKDHITRVAFQEYLVFFLFL